MTRLTIAGTVASSLLLAASCAAPPPSGDVPGRVSHVVLCWLKDPGNAVHRRRVVEVSRSFREIPGVVEVRVGTAVASDREIVDDSFDVCIYVTFADVEAMNAYLVHPRHVAAARDVLGPIAKRLAVYDFVE